jgi:exopolysaccharide biosynthesis protein
LFRKLGVSNAINVDGGDASAMVIAEKSVSVTIIVNQLAWTW